MLTITPADLAMFVEVDEAKAQAMIDDALALAFTIAPCLNDPDLDDVKVAAAKAIIRGAILRWVDAGSGVLQGQTAGPFGVTIDTRQPRRAMFWPSEIMQLQKICKGGSGAFSVDTVPRTNLSIHDQACDLRFGGPRCSCGADIAGQPIFGLGE
jgi:hypothetical protein